MVATTLLAWPIAKLFRRPFVTCVQNSFSKAAICMILGDRVITGCQAVATAMNGRGIPLRKLRAILNGTIGSARYSKPEPPAAVLQRPAVLTVCGLHPRKGVPDLIHGFEAAREGLPDIHLYIVGEGPYESAYKAMVSDAHKNHVHFITAIPDPRPYMLGADLFVLASHADPAPLVLPEAREAGLAVIATAVDGIPELLEFGKAGLLVPPRAPERISKAIVELLSDQTKLAEWRMNGQFNIDRLRVERVAIDTLAVYDELVLPRRQHEAAVPSLHVVKSSAANADRL
jgi:glycosyltransferase involved in cell wall biosynthesis